MVYNILFVLVKETVVNVYFLNPYNFSVHIEEYVISININVDKIAPSAKIR